MNIRIVKIAPFMQLAAARAQRKPRLTLPPALRQPVCLADRRNRPAFRATEDAAWQASGGDFLHRPQDH